NNRSFWNPLPPLEGSSLGSPCRRALSHQREEVLPAVVAFDQCVQELGCSVGDRRRRLRLSARAGVAPEGPANQLVIDQAGRDARLSRGSSGRSSLPLSRLHQTL